MVATRLLRQMFLQRDTFSLQSCLSRSFFLSPIWRVAAYLYIGLQLVLALVFQDHDRWVTCAEVISTSTRIWLCDRLAVILGRGYGLQVYELGLHLYTQVDFRSDPTHLWTQVDFRSDPAHLCMQVGCGLVTRVYNTQITNQVEYSWVFNLNFVPNHLNPL